MATRALREMPIFTRFLLWKPHRMGEHRQVAIDATNLPVTLLESEFRGNGGAAGRDHGKLNLRHATGMHVGGRNASTGPRVSSSMPTNPRFPG